MIKTHSKFKNTGIIFELLVRQIASDTLSGTDSVALTIIKESFQKDSELNKELQLYKAILEDKFVDKNQAEKFVDLVLEYRKALDDKKLSTERYEVVKKIKENYDLEKFFKTRVREYKPLASAMMLFENISNKSTLKPSEVITSRFNLLEYISKEPVQDKKEVTNKVIDDYKKMDEDIRLLAYKMLVENFNKTYSDVLNEDQKYLLKQYINNISDSTTLREYIDQQIPIIKEKIEKYSDSIDDEITKIKLTEVLEQLPNFLKGTIITENHILTLMKYYSLVQELEGVK